ncbi:hypothetical protein KZX37_01180 [Microbacterium sp. EYE_5]|uniref:hypothetical protein n=1 Tax=unclassified Microbacterium TaxID=2609290 RepID=UPI002005BFEC|nr:MULTISPECIES: hypothetical protein [unclassified Microbacterium]MCK6079229.1 hypothetical protein [Microbacterium sp. EYE_382]MCK6084499.1 hypothetical protein [Microbacterium sp. EYE_384]MCK6123272.1 hypothetical protein [Microbacterium sp. EYE_80]MCK6125263.1 hypothetical protein [Microbacterium sp. EYE_79]MCK6140183.1 hypothetical protein [Microbacterium sp. EYE_39]
MKGKIGIVVGLTAGYVLGARAGRQRYEQIKDAYLRVYNQPAVQKQVAKVTELGKSAAFAVPSVLWDGAVKVTRAATTKGTAGEKLDAALDASKDAAEDVKDAAETTADAASAKKSSSNGRATTGGATGKKSSTAS